MLVRYGHDDELNTLFSGMCALRVIWGGNNTVEHLRSIAMPAGASELAFAHKFSWAVLSTDAVIAAAGKDEIHKLAQSFVTDAFLLWSAGLFISWFNCVAGQLWAGTDRST